MHSHHTMFAWYETHDMPVACGNTGFFSNNVPQTSQGAYANNSKLMVIGEKRIQSKEDIKYLGIAYLEEHVSLANTRGGVILIQNRVMMLVLMLLLYTPIIQKRK